jgi:hypothetical protein
MRTLISVILLFVSVTVAHGQAGDTVICINCYAPAGSAFVINEISSADFIAHSAKYRPKLVIDSSRIELKDTVFIIKAGGTKLALNTEYNTDYANRRNFSWHEYRGFIPALDLYVIEKWWAGEFTTGRSLLIHRSTGTWYELTSFADGANVPPIVSPGNRYMISYSNDLFEPEGACKLSLIRIARKGKRISYEGLMEYEDNGYSIEDLVWVNDTSFAIKANTRSYNKQTLNWDDNFSYLCFTLPVKE